MSRIVPAALIKTRASMGRKPWIKISATSNIDMFQNGQTNRTAPMAATTAPGTKRIACSRVSSGRFGLRIQAIAMIATPARRAMTPNTTSNAMP